MGFQQGLSGLNISSKSLEVIGNNVANANTYGYKSARAEFADMYAASLGGAGNNGIGIGARIANVAQQFTQGNVSTTANNLDLAINGDGFFQVQRWDEVSGSGTLSPAGEVLYTRNGQFKVDSSGYIINNQDRKLLGVGNQPLQLNLNGGSAQPTQLITAQVNLNAADAETLAEAVKHAMYCAAICNSCADACSAEDMDMRRCIRLCSDCADVCTMAYRVASRRTDENRQLSGAAAALSGPAGASSLSIIRVRRRI